jgi:hypothetical protein
MEHNWKLAFAASAPPAMAQARAAALPFASAQLPFEPQ